MSSESSKLAPGHAAVLARAIYMSVLNRAPDPEGLQVAARALAAGETSAADLAAAMADSPEGRLKGAVLDADLKATLERWEADVTAIPQDPPGEPVVAPASAPAPPAPLMAAGVEYQALLAAARARPEPPLWVKGWKAFSQADEDGILHEIFRRLGKAGPATALEIGSADGLENITSHWVLNGAKAWWFEADPACVALARGKFAEHLAAGLLTVTQGPVEPETVADLATQAGAPAEVDLLAIDIDGNDWRVLARLLEVVRPMVMVVEYNARFGPVLDWTMPLTPGAHWNGADWFGASLAAFNRLAAHHGLALVSCNAPGTNAFFVSRDLVGEAFGRSFDPVDHWEPPRYHLVGAMSCGHPPDRDPSRAFPIAPARIPAGEA
jgi:hypothetical protein